MRCERVQGDLRGCRRSCHLDFLLSLPINEHLATAIPILISKVTWPILQGIFLRHCGVVNASRVVRGLDKSRLFDCDMTNLKFFLLSQLLVSLSLGWSLINFTLAEISTFFHS